MTSDVYTKDYIDTIKNTQDLNISTAIRIANNHSHSQYADYIHTHSQYLTELPEHTHDIDKLENGELTLTLNNNYYPSMSLLQPNATSTAFHLGQSLTSGKAASVEFYQGDEPSLFLSLYGRNQLEIRDNQIFLRRDSMVDGNLTVNSATTLNTLNVSGATEFSNPIKVWNCVNIHDTGAVNDYARIRFAGSSNAGSLEIATADDGSEPIYVRQYTGNFATVKRTLTLLDGSGNTSLPGSISAGSLSDSFKKLIVELIYPVGALHTSFDSTSPATRFGVGTWTQITD